MLTGNRDKIKARKRGQKPTDSRFVLKAGLTPFGCFSPKRRFKNQNLTKTKKQALCFRLLLIYSYSRRESNPHAVKHWILNPTCLPIPPLEHVEYKNKHLINKY